MTAPGSPAGTPVAVSIRHVSYVARPVRDRLLALLPELADPGEACIIWPRKPGSHGYGVIYDGKRQRSAAAVVCEQFVGPIPEGQEARHTCDNRPCVNPRHLLPGTRQQNVADMHERGRARKAQGEAASGAKLTAEQVARLREWRRQGATYRQLSEAFGITNPTVWAIVTGRSWREVA